MSHDYIQERDQKDIQKERPTVLQKKRDTYSAACWDPDVHKCQKNDTSNEYMEEIKEIDLPDSSKEESPQPALL